METFIDRDGDYLDWVKNNPRGFVVNCERSPRPNYLILHLTICWTITKRKGREGHWTKDYIKVCSLNRYELEIWARKEVGGQLQPCRFCNP